MCSGHCRLPGPVSLRRPSRSRASFWSRCEPSRSLRASNLSRLKDLYGPCPPGRSPSRSLYVAPPQSKSGSSRGCGAKMKVCKFLRSSTLRGFMVCRNRIKADFALGPGERILGRFGAVVAIISPTSSTGPTSPRSSLRGHLVPRDCARVDVVLDAFSCRER
jgi:hypothetical protein